MPTTLESATTSKSHNALTAKWACLWLNLMVANEDKLDITISNEFKLCQTAKAVGLRPSDVLTRPAVVFPLLEDSSSSRGESHSQGSNKLAAFKSSLNFDEETFDLSRLARLAPFVDCNATKTRTQDTTFVRTAFDLLVSPLFASAALSQSAQGPFRRHLEQLSIHTARQPIECLQKALSALVTNDPPPLNFYRLPSETLERILTAVFDGFHLDEKLMLQASQKGETVAVTMGAKPVVSAHSLSLVNKELNKLCVPKIWRHVDARSASIPQLDRLLQYFAMGKGGYVRHFCLDTGPSGHLFSEQMTHADCLRFNLQERILSQLPHLDTLDIELFPTYIPKTLGTIAHNLKEMHVTVNALQGDVEDRWMDFHFPSMVNLRKLSLYYNQPQDYESVEFLIDVMNMTCLEELSVGGNGCLTWNYVDAWFDRNRYSGDDAIEEPICPGIVGTLKSITFQHISADWLLLTAFFPDFEPGPLSRITFHDSPMGEVPTATCSLKELEEITITDPSPLHPAQLFDSYSTVFRATKVKALTIRITRIADRWDFLRHLGSALLAVDGMMQSVAAIRLEAPYTFTSDDIDTLYIPAVAACISFVHNMPDHEWDLFRKAPKQHRALQQKYEPKAKPWNDRSLDVLRLRGERNEEEGVY